MSNETKNRVAKASLNDLISRGWNIRNKYEAEKLAETFGVHWLGTNNQPPINFREVSEAEFAQGSWGDYSAVMSKFNQISYKGEFFNITLNVDAFGDGWGYSKRYHEKRVRWFVFKACNHEWKQTLSRMCYREYVCVKCETKKTVDSSD